MQLTSGCSNHPDHFRCGIRTKGSETTNEIKCFGSTSDLSLPGRIVRCLSNAMKDLDCQFDLASLQCIVSSSNFELHLIGGCIQHENRPSRVEDTVSERFSCSVSSPTNQEISRIHCWGYVLSQQATSGTLICTDNNVNRLNCEFSIIAIFVIPTWFQSLPEK
jgi:hypothetical protein